VAKNKRNFLDEIAEGIRRTLDELDQLLNPGKRLKRKPIPVPARVRPDDRQDPQAPQR
jgi:hypothetical protein